MVSATQTVNPLIHVFHLDLDPLNHKLEEYVHEEIKRTKGLAKELRHSNIGGWHSERNLDAKLGDGSPLSALLLQVFDGFSGPMTQYITACHAKFNISPKESYEWNYAGAWFNVAFQGSYNAPHVHPDCQISGAYYIRTEDPNREYPMSGRIDFIQNNIQYPFFPKPGTLILFPSDMLHWVHPYYGSDIRICLSFNAKNIH